MKPFLAEALEKKSRKPQETTSFSSQWIKFWQLRNILIAKQLNKPITHASVWQDKRDDMFRPLQQ